MINRTAGRALTVAGLAAVLVGTAAGAPAGAVQKVGPPYTAWKAFTDVLDPRSGFRSDVTVTEVDGAGTSVDIQLFKDGWVCIVTGEPTVATVTSLESARIEAVLSYSCTEDSVQGIAGTGSRERQAKPSTLAGSAAVRMSWTGVGDVEDGPMYHCVGRYLVRGAAVDGQVQLFDSRSRSVGTMRPNGDGQLSYDQNVCPPGVE